LIAGFPGESEDQFRELLQFVRDRRFERLGAFAFCAEPGTPAAGLDGHWPEPVRHERRDRLLAAQQEVAFAWNEAQVGRRMDVIVDRCISPQEHAYVGRCYADAPEVDGVVYITGEGLREGEIVSCEIVASAEYDLIGVAAGAASGVRA
jgi:ribosomal protein S12 methylthiotransferase